MSKQLTTDVLIIGGGPAGMLSAIYLDILGVNSLVLERKAEISRHPKAHELSARSIEILQQLGFTLEELKAEASSYRDASRVLFGHTINHELGEIDLLEGGNDKKYEAHLASPEPYLNLSQTELEKLIRKRLRKCPGSQLLLSHQWESSEEGEDRVISKVKKLSDGNEITIESTYVICADGAGSRSRKGLGIEMIGEDKINDFISVYFELNLRDYLKKPAKLFWIMNPAAPGTFIAHHIEKRWVYHFPIFTPYEKKEDYTEEILKERILTALGNPNIPLEIDSISFWRMTCQIAEKFRKGRAFLVGDAAHRFPPTGGLGMNSGIGDIQNLCWKLAYVMQGKAKKELLDTYETERRPIIELNSKESLRNYFKIWEVPQSMGLNPHAIKWQAMFLNSFFIKLLPQSWIDALLKKAYAGLSKKILAIPENPKLHEKVKAVIKDQTEHFDRIGLDLGYAYEEGAIIREETQELPTQGVSEYTPSLVPGVRFPHFWVIVDGEKRSSHTWLSPEKFTLLCNYEGAAWWQKYASEFIDKIHILNVEEGMVKSSSDSLVRSLYPIQTIPLVLVRPDGQIAWRPRDLNLDLLSIFEKLMLSHVHSTAI
ncbi:MAG: FAD-dependent monooxygenase [Bacteroidota bacterium]